MISVMKLLSRRSLAAIALLPVLALAAACGSSSSKAGPASTTTGSSGPALTKSTIVIGNIGSYTNAGQFGPQYQQAAHSLQAWANWTNANGGLNGHPVRVIVKDDGNNPATSLTDVKELIQQDHVVAILSAVAPGTDIAWGNYVKSEKVPIIGGLSLDGAWDGNPYVLSTNVDTISFLTSEFAAAKLYGTKLGVVTCAELAACKQSVPFFPQVAKQIGIGFTNTQLVASTSVGYVAQCLALKQAGTDILVSVLDAPTTFRVVQSCAQQNFKPTLVVPAATITAAALKDSGFDGAVGVTVSPLWFGDSPVTSTWATTYKQEYPNDVLSSYATLGWQAGVVFAAALKNAPDTVTSLDVMNGLYAQPAKSTFGGWTPALTFTAGKSTTTSPCMWQVQDKGGQLTAPKGQDPVCPS
jgi:branched-chain amino acid transport system substrate-binding protein